MARPAAILSVIVKAGGVAQTNKQLATTTSSLNSANTAGARTQKRMMGVGKATRHASGGFAAMAKSAAGFVAVYASLKGLEKSVKTTEELGHSVLGLKKNFGLATKEASRWAAVTKSRDIDGKKLSMGFKTLSTQTAQAAAGSKVARKQFEDLGISQKELRKHGDNLHFMLRRVSDGIQKIPGGTKRAAVMSKLFGRSWMQLSPLIREGSTAMDKQLKMADKYGATLGGKGVRSVEKMIVAQREAKLASIGLQVTLGTTLIPVITKVIAGAAKFSAQFRAGKGSAGQLRAGIDSVLKVLAPFVESVKQIVHWLGEHQKIAKTLIAVLTGLAVAMWAVNAAMAANPITLVVLALAGLTVAIVTAYRESTTFRTILDSVFSWLKGAAAATAAAVVAAFGWIQKTWHTVTTSVVGEVRKWDVLFGFFRGFAAFLGTFLKPALTLMRTAFKIGLALIVPIVKGFWELIKGIFKGAWILLKAITSGGLQVIRGVIKVFGGIFKGDFHQIWDGVKDIFLGAFKILKGVLGGMWAVLKGGLSGFKKAFIGFWSGVWSGIKSIFESGVNAVIDFINLIIKAINLIPGLKDIGLIDHVGGGTPRMQNLGQTGHMARGGAFGRTGGIVNKPITLMGEEAPRHPEIVIPTNPAYRNRAKRLTGMAASVVGLASGGAFGGTTMTDVGGSLSRGVTGANDIISKLPNVGGLPGWLKGMGGAVLKAATRFIESKVSSFFGGKHPGGPGLGGLVTGGVKGVGSYKGVPMALWVIEALQHAASKGVSPQPTSGYRPGFDPHTASGRSEHQGIQYPHGAVDFGGFTTGLAQKMAVVGATSDFRHPLLAPIGFRDDGHASGTGHKKGGIFKAAFKKGGVYDKYGHFFHWERKRKHPIGSPWTNGKPRPVGMGVFQGEVFRWADANKRNRAPGMNSPRMRRWFDAWNHGKNTGGKKFAKGGVFGGAVSALAKGGKYSATGMAKLWDKAGGKKTIDLLMGHVGMAESVGDPNAHNASGATGLWQILGQLVGGNLRDPFVNAKNAVAKYKLQGLGAWAASKFSGYGGGWGKYLNSPQSLSRAAGKGPGGKAKSLGPLLSTKRRKKLHAKLKRIAAIGLPPKVAGHLNSYSKTADVAEEMASRAEQLGTPVGGKDQTQWLNQELNALFQYRNAIITAMDATRRIRERLKIRIALAKWARSSLTQRIDGLSQHPKENAKPLHKARGQLKYYNALIGGLGDKRSSLGTTGSELASALETVQGIGSPRTRMKTLPALGVLGGRIFATQMAIQGLGSKVSAVDSGDTLGLTEALGLLHDANLRTGVSQAQYNVFRGMQQFGGGGIISGPPGAAVPVIGHGREGVFTPDQMAAMGSTDVRVVVEDRRIRVFVDEVEQIVRQVTRKQARGAGRGLPSRGGG